MKHLLKREMLMHIYEKNLGRIYTKKLAVVIPLCFLLCSSSLMHYLTVFFKMDMHYFPN